METELSITEKTALIRKLIADTKAKKIAWECCKPNKSYSAMYNELDYELAIKICSVTKSRYATLFINDGIFSVCYVYGELASDDYTSSVYYDLLSTLESEIYYYLNPVDKEFETKTELKKQKGVAKLRVLIDEQLEQEKQDRLSYKVYKFFINLFRNK